MRLLKNTHIQFIKVRYYAYALSLIILATGLVAIFTKGLNWSIDFTSGVAMEVNLAPSDPSTPPLRIDVLRSVLRENGFTDAEIQRIGDSGSSHFLIKTKGTADGTGSRIMDVISQKLPDYVRGKDLGDEDVLKMDAVGPKVGEELRSQALLAVLLSFALMIIYIWIRFELTFGFAAILALFHDVICIVGVFAIMGKEITIQIVAALLTIVGYSINDTIVTYDRIREDLRIFRKDSYETVFNNAINKTLSRTIITASTTLFTALSLYLFGGTVIHDFAFAIVLGMIFGTYSSIFIASSVVIDYFHITHKEKSSLQTLTSKGQTRKR